jgi:hypothetical protein
MQKILLENKGIHGVQALIKFLALLATLYLIFRYIQVNPVAFVVGVSILLVGILSEAFRETFRYERKGNP